MIVRFKKESDGGGTLVFVREDGSSTWMRATRFFVQHDLMHYAVETAMGFRNAFLGLVAGGKDLADFEDNAKSWLPPEALVVETIVSQLMYERAGSASPDEFHAAVDAACAGLGLPAQAITPAQAAAARARFDELLDQWRSTPSGEMMQLPWPAP